MNNQISMFDLLYSKYKITKPIRLIEFFAGYGSQALALKYLGVEFEHWKICEWAIKSIQAYKDIHFTNDNLDYSWCYENKEDIADYLYEQGISSNYNEPMTKEQINRLNENQLRTIYNNIRATHNLVNIQTICGKDLEIVDTDKYDYILTYSFPCQDLSLAGKGKGMSDTSTRSGMLWEVERILSECYELGTMPQILLMENVPQVHGTDNIKDFNKWQLRLEELGYKNYVEDLIATDYGIPQTRNRCFMVSILGDYSYTFPKPIPLKLKLKDMLEENVDEKYYISDKLLKYYNKKIEQGWRKELHTSEDVAMTICNPGRNQINDNFIKVKNATKKGYLEATDGDGIDISSRMEYHRGTVQKEKIQTITTSGGNDRGVVIGSTQKNDGNMITLTTRGDCVGVVVNPLKGISGKSWQFEQQVYDENGSARTLKASEGSGNIPKVIVKGIATNESEDWQKQPLEEKSRTLLTNKSNAGVGVIDTDLRIRKLTPKECFRLMGVKDEDYEKCAKNQSNASLYHLAGDSIVVNVLMAIFGELL